MAQQSQHNAPMPGDDQWPSNLIDLLRRQRVLVQELSARASQQESMIREGRAEALVGLLTQRQELIDSLTASQESFTSQLTDLDHRLQGATDDERQQIKGLVDEIGDVLTGVLRRDETDREGIEAYRERVKQDLAKLSDSQDANTAYRSNNLGGQTQKFADKCG